MLGASFKVMVLIEGFTEVRPANAIPPIAGLAFGWVGALACGLANFAADFFGTIQPSSILGIFANFIAAYLPYRLWHLFSAESPNVRTYKGILLYICVCIISAFATSWFLSFGLQLFFGKWIEEMYTYVFFNNMGFSIGLGMPILIIITSDSVALECEKRKRYLLLKTKKISISVTCIFSALMLIIFTCVFFFDLNPQANSWLHIFSAISVVGLVSIVI